MDTIAAISTGNQITAIGILRLSGPEAFPAADAVFRSRFDEYAHEYTLPKPVAAPTSV